MCSLVDIFKTGQKNMEIDLQILASNKIFELLFIESSMEIVQKKKESLFGQNKWIFLDGLANFFYLFIVIKPFSEFKYQGDTSLFEIIVKTKSCWFGYILSPVLHHNLSKSFKIEGSVKIARVVKNLVIAPSSVQYYFFIDKQTKQ